MDNLVPVLLDNVALIGALVSFFVIAIVSTTLFGNNKEKDALVRRLARVSGAPVENNAGNGSIRAGSFSNSKLEKILTGLVPEPEALQNRILQAGFRLSVGRLGLICLALFILSFAGFMILLDRAALLAATSALSLSVGLPWMVIRNRSNARLSNFTAYLPDALDLMCRGLRAGLPVMDSIATVGEELPDPIGSEFRDLQSRVQMGSTLEDAFWEMEKRIPSDELRFLITAISIQRETGGNLAETLGNLSDLLRKRKQFKLKVKAMSSEARASAYIIGSLPFAMFGILSLLNPGYISILISDPRGIGMAVFGLLMIGMGAFIMMRLVKFEA